MKSHTEILLNIWEHKDALEKVLGLPYVWIRGKEFVVDRQSGEAADLVFHLLMLCEARGIAFDTVLDELKKRQK